MSRAMLLLREQAAFGLVLLIVLGSVVALVISPQHWRYGAAILASGLLVGAVFRLVLPDSMQGELRVRRSRTVDVLLYAVSGGLMLLLVALLHA